MELRKAAQKLANQGRDGDTILAHINPWEAMVLKALGGSGTVNPKTGVLEFRFGGGGSPGASGNSSGPSGNDGGRDNDGIGGYGNSDPGVAGVAGGVAGRGQSTGYGGKAEQADGGYGGRGGGVGDINSFGDVAVQAFEGLVNMATLGFVDLNIDDKSFFGYDGPKGISADPIGGLAGLAAGPLGKAAVEAGRLAMGDPRAGMIGLASLDAPPSVQGTKASTMQEQQRDDGWGRDGGREDVFETAQEETPAEDVAEAGRDGDTLVAEVTPWHQAVLLGLGGSGTVNPTTGLREFAMRREAFDPTVYAQQSGFQGSADDAWAHYESEGRNKGFAANAAEKSAKDAGWTGNFAGNWGEVQSFLDQKNTHQTPAAQPGTRFSFAPEIEQWMQTVDPRTGMTYNQSVARTTGYGGPFGSGGHIGAMSNDPNMLASWRRGIEESYNAHKANGFNALEGVGMNSDGTIFALPRASNGAVNWDAQAQPLESLPKLNDILSGKASVPQAGAPTTPTQGEQIKVPTLPSEAELRGMTFDQIKSYFPSKSVEEIFALFPHLSASTGISFSKPTERNGARRVVNRVTGEVEWVPTGGFGGVYVNDDPWRSSRRGGFGNVVRF